MDYGLFGVRFLFPSIKGVCCKIENYSSILQQTLLAYILFLQFSYVS